MFASISKLIQAHISLARVETTVLETMLDDRDARVIAEARKAEKERKAKKKAKREARELIETIAAFAPLLGVAGAVLGHLFGKEEGKAIGERIGSMAQAKLEETARQSDKSREKAEERRRNDETERLEREQDEREARVNGLCFLIRSALETGDLGTSQVIELCKSHGSFNEIQDALNSVGEPRHVGRSGNPTIWTLKDIISSD